MRRSPKRRLALWGAALSMWVMMTPIFLFRFLPWPGQVAACVLAVIVGRWIAGKGRALVVTTAPPVPDAADLAAAEAMVAERTTALAGAPAMYAAGSQGLRDIARRYRSTGRWQPAGDPEADRTALLAGQAFRVVALRRASSRWRSGHLRIGGQPLTVSWVQGIPALGRRPRSAMLLGPQAHIAATRPVDPARDRFPRTNYCLFTVVTIQAPGRREMLVIPSLDAPLVHGALELAAAESSP